MSAHPTTFRGWLGLDKDSVDGKMVWQEYQPKAFSETDVDIEITHCGICATDISTLRSGWGPTNYPVCTGHEIVGYVVRVGSQVKDVKVGDRAGVGTQSYACENAKGDCAACADGGEQHCRHIVLTYDAKWEDGSKTYGGFADYWRGPGAFVYKIPDSLSSEAATPIFCAGITGIGPLMRNNVAGKRVGVLGVGGIGHMAILGAKALDAAEIVVVSRTSVKREDAFRLGATKFIATDEEPNWAGDNASTLDLIVSTVSSPKMPLQGYLGMLRYRGRMVQCGAPEDNLPSFNAFVLLGNAASLEGTLTGSRKEIRELLQLCAEKGIKPWTNVMPMEKANDAVVDMVAGKARYKYVLVNEKHLR